MKRFAVMSGVMMDYEFHGDAISVLDGLVVVFDSNGQIKIALCLDRGQSVMHVTDVIGPERTINAVSSA